MAHTNKRNANAIAAFLYKHHQFRLDSYQAEIAAEVADQVSMLAGRRDVRREKIKTPFLGNYAARSGELTQDKLFDIANEAFVMGVYVKHEIQEENPTRMIRALVDYKLDTELPEFQNKPFLYRTMKDNAGNTLTGEELYNRVRSICRDVGESKGRSY